MPYANREEQMKAPLLMTSLETFEDACDLADIYTRHTGITLMVDPCYGRYIVRTDTEAILQPESFVDYETKTACYSPTPKNASTGKVNVKEWAMEIDGGHPAVVGTHDCMRLAKLGAKYSFWEKPNQMLAQAIMRQLEETQENRALIDILSLVMGFSCIADVGLTQSWVD
jgi:hypothetical protein